MLQEFDVVKSVRTMKNVPKDAIGTILVIHPDTPMHYFVEFMDEDGNTIDLLTVSEEDIALYHRA